MRNLNVWFPIYSYVVTDYKLMLLDIQGSESTLYDPEIATEEIMDADGKEVYFCCGNCQPLQPKHFCQTTNAINIVT